MTTTLRVIVDDISHPTSSGVSRYAEELTRELIGSAPANCLVAGVVASAPPSEYDSIEQRLPGLATLHKSALARRELQLAWQHGITRLPGSGMVHAPSLLAPLARHDRGKNPLDQIVVTIHDAIAWTRPELLAANQVSWTRAMGKRAERYADAVVVPSYSVAENLGDALDLGDRVRVIGGAVSPKLQVPPDAAARAQRLDLPDRYLLAIGSLEPRKGIQALIRSLAAPADVGLPLLIVGPDRWGDRLLSDTVTDAGVDGDRVRALNALADADLAVVFDRATVFSFPSLAEGFGLSMLEAFGFGVPVVHSDDAAVVEVAAGAGLTVAIHEQDSYPARLAAAIRGVVEDPPRAERMRYAGFDRAKGFSWRDSAQRVWQLHADL